MRKLKLITHVLIFLVIFSFMTMTNVRAVSGDFYNITKKTKYSRVNLISNKDLAKQLQSQMDNGDIVGKELSDGSIIDYNSANELFISLLKSMTVQQALVSAVSSQNVKINKATVQIESFNEASLETHFDVISID